MNVIFHKEGHTRVVDNEEYIQLLKSDEWADSPAHFGIETCPGVTPNAVIAARASEIKAASILPAAELKDVEMPTEWDLSTMTREQLFEVALNRTLEVDKRWGRERLLEALSDHSA